MPTNKAIFIVSPSALALEALNGTYNLLSIAEAAQIVMKSEVNNIMRFPEIQGYPVILGKNTYERIFYPFHIPASLKSNGIYLITSTSQNKIFRRLGLYSELTLEVQSNVAKLAQNYIDSIISNAQGPVQDSRQNIHLQTDFTAIFRQNDEKEVACFFLP